MKNIIFELNRYNTQISSKATHFDCYVGSKHIGYFEVYTDYNNINLFGQKKKREIYIEVFDKFQGNGYSKLIYLNFLKKRRQLGFNDKLFYAYILNVNKKSLNLHTSLGFAVYKKYKTYTIFEVTDVSM